MKPSPPAWGSQRSVAVALLLAFVSAAGAQSAQMGVSFALGNSERYPGNAPKAQRARARASFAPHSLANRVDLSARAELVHGRWQLRVNGTLYGQSISYVGQLSEQGWSPPLPVISGDLPPFTPVLESPEFFDWLAGVLAGDAGREAEGGTSPQGLPATPLTASINVRTAPLKFRFSRLGTKDELQVANFLLRQGWSDDEIRHLFQTGLLPEGRTLGDNDDPNDCGPDVEFTVCAEVTVNIPPFGELTFSLCQTYRVPRCQLAEARRQAFRELQEALQEMIEEARRRAQEQMNNIRDLIDRYVRPLWAWLFR